MRITSARFRSASTRTPSYLISKHQSAPEGGRSASVASMSGTERIEISPLGAPSDRTRSRSAWSVPGTSRISSTVNPVITDSG